MITITWKPKPLHVISALTGILWGRKRCRPPRVAAFPWLGKYSFGTAQAVFRSTEVGGYMSGLSHPHMTNTHTYTGKDNTLRIHCPVTDSALSALVSLSLCFSIHCSGFNSVLCSHHFRDWNVPWFCVVQDKVQNLSLKNLLRYMMWNERWLWIQWRGNVLHLLLICRTPINFAFLRWHQCSSRLVTVLLGTF